MHIPLAQPIMLETLIYTLPMSPHQVLEALRNTTQLKLTVGTLLATLILASRGLELSSMEEM
jgi:hypothetical protein